MTKRRIKIDGTFEGEMECKFYDGRKCLLMDRSVARSVLKFIQKKELSEEDKMHVAAFMLRLEGITRNEEG